MKDKFFFASNTKPPEFLFNMSDKPNSGKENRTKTEILNDWNPKMFLFCDDKFYPINRDEKREIWEFRYILRDDFHKVIW